MRLRRMFGALFVASILVGVAGATPAPGEQRKKVDYNRDVRPILAGSCYTCHGPDARQRKARLRLDVKERALRKLRSGGYAIVPGDVSKSVLIDRITATDDEDVMPPPDSGKTLSVAQIETLRRWVEQGAEWTEHWSYVLPKRFPVPAVKLEAWTRTPIDRFILSRLEKKRLRPSRDADRITLLRRLSFDVTGLPPTPAEVDAFLLDNSQGAYEAQVDRLLRSKHYGERMAMFWLDLVRFADSRGYHSDNPRNVAPYRDYVIRAFNDNLRFDRFTIEQLAGDLLPEPTLWQRVASCYNKLNQTTEEGGAQAKEYEAKSAADRVRNASVVWMGATMGCAECHEHKFDPYEAKDFYSFAAFFADIQERPIGDRDQGVPVPTAEQEAEVRRVDERIATLKGILESPTPELNKAQESWEKQAVNRPSPRFGPWHAIGPFRATSFDEAFEMSYPPEQKIDLTASYETGKLKWRKEAGWGDGTVHSLEGQNAATYLYRKVEIGSDGTVALSLGSDDGIQVWLDGRSVLSRKVSRGVAPDQEKLTVPLSAGRHDLLMKITNGGGGYGFYFKPLDSGGVPAEIQAVLQVPAAERNTAQREVLASYYRKVAPLLQPTREELARLEKQRAEVTKNAPRCLVSVSGNPRTVRVLRRGNWMDTGGEVVEPAIPGYFGKLETGERRATRLDLAKWLVSRDNPLTARVFVNRLWKLFFGVGISKRLDDLGAMGEPPLHPELLDWLAVEFVESGWNIKHVVKLFLMSSTYRQSSVETAELRRRDPYNRLFARQSRWRLDAELVRDNALAVSGLLVRKIGGPSVKPYQPEGYWRHLNFPKRRWTADSGPNAYRRGLYTWWQRSFLHPSLMAFDAPNREECTADRSRSNIPQQALVLLNDPTYVEASRAFASLIMTEGGEPFAQRVHWAWRRALSRRPDAGEADVLAGLYEKHLAKYRADADATRKLLAVGLSPVPAGLDPAELAAWTSVARTILNLHETVTRN